MNLAKAQKVVSNDSRRPIWETDVSIHMLTTDRHGFKNTIPLLKTPTPRQADTNSCGMADYGMTTTNGESCHLHGVKVSWHQCDLYSSPFDQATPATMGIEMRLQLT